MPVGWRIKISRLATLPSNSGVLSDSSSALRTESLTVGEITSVMSSVDEMICAASAASESEASPAVSRTSSSALILAVRSFDDGDASNAHTSDRDMLICNRNITQSGRATYYTGVLKQEYVHLLGYEMRGNLLAVYLVYGAVVHFDNFFNLENHIKVVTFERCFGPNGEKNKVSVRSI